MTLLFSCECGQPLRAKEGYAGQFIRCPACERQQRVPGLPDAIQPAVSTEAVQRRPRSHAARTDNDFDEGRRPWADAPASRKAVVSLVLGILSLPLVLLAGIPAVIFGALGLREISQSRGRLSGYGLAITGLVLGIVGTVLTAPAVLLLGGLWFDFGPIASSREDNRLADSAANLRQIGIAMHHFHDAHNHFPPAGTVAVVPGGGVQPPTVSWRVQLLPYLEQDHLFRQYNLNEPWDGPNNSRLLSQMPKVYALPGQESAAPPGHTFYRVFVSQPQTSPRAAFTSLDPRFPGMGRVRIAEFTDGTSNTILAVEAAEAVPWTKPDELEYDPGKPLPALGGHYRRGYHALFADGSVRLMRENLDVEMLRRMITRDDGLVIDVDD